LLLYRRYTVRDGYMLTELSYPGIAFVARPVMGATFAILVNSGWRVNSV